MTKAESALVPTKAGDERQEALLKAIGFDKLSEPERELALNIAQRYDLDPLLGHVVLIDGRAYITRDGLLHVAHASGQFDGIEVTEPIMMDDGQWRCLATVWRKDMAHPFVYAGRYAAANRKRGNAAYEPEMAIKVAEVMALRRAFDVSAPSVEERWNEAANAVEGEAKEVSSIDDALDAKLAAIPETLTIETTTVIPAEGPPAIVSPKRATPSEPVGEYGTFSGAPKTPPLKGRDEDNRLVEPITPKPMDQEQYDAEVQAAVPADETVAESGGVTLEQFKAAIKDVDREYVRLMAKQTFPDAKAFGDLDEQQLSALLNLIETSVPELQPVACGVQSPFSDKGVVCILLKGHKELHQATPLERWS